MIANPRWRLPAWDEWYPPAHFGAFNTQKWRCCRVVSDPAHPLQDFRVTCTQVSSELTRPLDSHWCGHVQSCYFVPTKWQNTGQVWVILKPWNHFPACLQNEAFPFLFSLPSPFYSMREACISHHSNPTQSSRTGLLLKFTRESSVSSEGFIYSNLSTH